MIVTIVLFLGFPIFVSTLNVTVCDCDQVQKEELYKITSDCSSILYQERKKSVAYDYEIYTNHLETITYPGYLCSRWLSQFTVEKNWLNIENDKPLKKIALDTSEENCRLLIETKNCAGVRMVFNEGRWEYIQDADGPGSYEATITYTVQNCYVQAIHLEKQCDEESCSTITPFGVINSTDNFYTHNHKTIVWERSWSTINKARLRRLEYGIGKLVEMPNKLEFRLSDSIKQIEFHLNLPSIKVSIDGYDWYNYTVTNMPGVMAYIKPSVLSVGSFNNSIATKLSTVEIQIDSAAHIQFNSDRQTDIDNLLQQRIDFLNCKTTQAKQHQAIAVAQYDGWLAAHILQLPQCSKVRSLGNILLVVRCKGA